MSATSLLFKCKPVTPSTREDWKAYRQTKDPKLRDRLITANVSLVRVVAGRLALQLPSHVDLDELEGAGTLGLLHAVEHYDPNQPTEFTTYAQHRIRGAILDELRAQDLAPRSLRAKARQIEQALCTLETTLGREPADEEVASALGVDCETYWQRLNEIRGMVLMSLDEPVTDPDHSEHESLAWELPDRHAGDPLTTAAVTERVQLLGTIIEGLPERERQVLALYYYEELTMKEIGRVLGVTESRVSMLHTAAILRMRARLSRANLHHDDLVLDDSAAFSLRELVLAVLMSLGLVIGGCVHPTPPPPLRPAVITSEGRTVVLPARVSAEDQPLVAALARLFVLELSRSGMDVQGPDWLRDEARAHGWDVSLPVFREGVSLKDGDVQPPAIDWEALGATRALVVMLTGVDQHWEAAERVTRVGVEARMIALPSGVVLWAGKIAPGSAGTAGWSFEHSTRVAVRKLVENLVQRYGH